MSNLTSKHHLVKFLLRTTEKKHPRAKYLLDKWAPIDLWFQLCQEQLKEKLIENPDYPLKNLKSSDLSNCLNHNPEFKHKCKKGQLDPTVNDTGIFRVTNNHKTLLYIARTKGVAPDRFKPCNTFIPYVCICYCENATQVSMVPSLYSQGLSTTRKL